jgi:hypothetical protein
MIISIGSLLCKKFQHLIGIFFVIKKLQVIFILGLNQVLIIDYALFTQNIALVL